MAKSIVLYGVLLGAVICFCSYVGGVDISGYRESGFSNELSGKRFEILGNKFELLIKKGNRLGAGDEVNSDVNENLIRNQIKQIYSAEIGVREKTGKNDGKRVEEYLAVTQLGKGYAWCAAFVSWVFAEAGFPQPRTPWSPSLFPKNRVVWEYLKPNTPNLTPNLPATADVFAIYFANLKRIAHVGFVDEWGDKYVITVEGNTNDGGANEGDGVYKKRRLNSSIYQVSNWVKEQERAIQ